MKKCQILILMVLLTSFKQLDQIRIFPNTLHAYNTQEIENITITYYYGWKLPKISEIQSYLMVVITKVEYS
jgi:hypothetical protein